MLLLARLRSVPLVGPSGCVYQRVVWIGSSPSPPRRPAIPYSHPGPRLGVPQHRVRGVERFEKRALLVIQLDIERGNQLVELGDL